MSSLNTINLDKDIPDIIIIRLPAFRAVTSGLAPWDEVMGAFGAWQSAHNHFFTPILFDCPDFLTGKDGKAEWLWAVKENITEADTHPYKIIDFPGGLYAVAVSVDNNGASHDKVRRKIEKWLEGTNFTPDEERAMGGNMPYADDEIKKGLGYEQLALYTPIKLRPE